MSVSLKRLVVGFTKIGCQLKLVGQLEDEVWRSVVVDWQAVAKSRNLESRNQILSGPIPVNFS
jgi:hypothetical protein